MSGLRPDHRPREVLVSCYDHGHVSRLSEMPSDPKHGCPKCGGKVRINSPRPKVENR